MLINLPEKLAQDLQTMASRTMQPIESLVIDHLQAIVDDPLAVLPLDEQAELKALRFLSDDALWTIAAEQMPSDAQTQVHVLLARNPQLTDVEAAELENLIARGDRLMVRKAEAATILRERGHHFTQK